MKFSFEPQMIFGAVLILWGISIIVKLLWGIEIPILKPLLAFFLIYLGLMLLFGPNNKYFYKETYYTYTVEPDQDKKL